MPNESSGAREMTAAEKHEAARAFALSGTLSKYQLNKRKKAREAAAMMAKPPPPARASNQKTIRKPPKPTPTTFPHTHHQTISHQHIISHSTPVAAPAPAPIHSSSTSSVTNTTDSSASSSTSTNSPTDSETDKNSWPRVNQGDWQYVYIANGPFEGKVGYYDDQEQESAVIYFEAPLDGPFCVPLEDLRVPPAGYGRDSVTTI